MPQKAMASASPMTRKQTLMSQYSGGVWARRVPATGSILGCELINAPLRRSVRVRFGDRKRPSLGADGTFEKSAKPPSGCNPIHTLAVRRVLFCGYCTTVGPSLEV